MRRLMALLLWMALAPVVPASADPPDLHDYWDGRCKSCHGDAGDFARSTLQVEQGRLIGRHHRDRLDEFLQQHYLADDWVAPVTAMLVAQVTTAPVFKAKCSGCHGSAADFARKSLLLRDGVPVGKAGNRPVADYLRAHGGLAPDEIAPMVETLKRVLGEVGRGAG
ncbi:hypothetical protein Lcho_2160 [Leptothrix cholodnii SP-6]|uniref:Cytochrome c domain-containing protein n=1 Tax=Leptothrix cholodnii (strain ATCC 51168 / LMG 8142 / SP-6) TaxID=395495 RepID=B1Y2T4_LEPCP|nr:hypothetical protein [Leptothrix cholodnii]ACB34426.1 hypothetical protein Lcho_2160 [Leptothrix cholodnii SP-6]